MNGNHLKVDVLFGRDYTTLSCRGVSHNLSWGLRPCQSNIEGMVYIMENLKICKGFLVEEGVDGNMYEVWVDVSDGGNKECRVRAHHCKIILSFCGTVDCCETCSKKSRRATKRISAREELENAPPNKIHKNPVDTKDCVLDSESLQKLLNEGAPEQLHLLLRMQLENSRPGLEKHQRKWDPEFISFCLSIYVKSPRVYSDLRNSKMLILPSESLLRMYKNCVKQKPGLCDDNLIWMEKEAKRQNVSAFGKRGGLVIDEMSIQDDLQVVRKGDAWCIVGGVDMGETNNLLSIISNKGKKAELATHCLQFIFHGLSGFRWPVAYYGSNPATTHQIFINFWECVDALDEHGFTVDYVMLDGASTNRAFMNMLLNDRARGSDYTTTDIYNIDHKVFIIQDSKHVIKRIRNSIESSKMANRAAPGRHLSLDDQPIVWEHFEDAYAFNQQSGLRIHRHLTKEHIELTSASKMRNRLAEQVLDKDMLFLMKSYQATVNEPERLSATIQLLEKTSVLVEFFGDTRPICDPWDKRVKELDDIRNFFCKWESCIQKSVKYTPAKHLFPQETRDDINSAIVGFQNLCRSLLGRGDSITPAYVNSDVVENHFCQQRGICNGLNTNPTLAQYGPSNTSICLSQTSVSSKRNASTKALNFRATTPCPLNTRR